MKKTEILGWLGNICFVIGAYLVAIRDIHCFYLHIMGNICYIGLGIRHRLWSLVTISMFLLMCAIYGLINWS